MTEQAENAIVHRERGISPVWLVPLVAVVVAGWLGFQSWRERGVDISIVFDSAAGIEVNKTELRYKDVRVGVVRSLRLTPDLKAVTVSAEVVPEIADQLSVNSRFWVVSPKISASGISGLNTLISGVYIGVDPGEEGEGERDFIGSLTAQSVDSEAEGKAFRLRSESLGSLDVGTPIYYREVPAGEVIAYQLDDNGRYVTLDVFVKAPYDRYVHRQSRFWNISGVGLELSDRGLKAHVGSLASILAGGIAFDTPEDLKEPELAEEDSLFLLYPDAQSVDDGIYTARYFYRFHFNGSVRGLNVGAPVEFRGIQIGEVVSIKFSDSEDIRFQIDVLVAFEPQRLDRDFDGDAATVRARLGEMVAGGMKGQLKVGNLLTGALFIDLINEQDNPGEVVDVAGEYSLLPTAEAPLDQVSRQLGDLLNKANQFPIEQLGKDLSTALGSLERVMIQFESESLPGKVGDTLSKVDQVAGSLEKTLEQTQRSLLQLEKSLQAANQTIAPDAPLIFEMQQMVQEVKAASVSFRRLTEELNRAPNSLIFGKETR